MPRRRPRRSRMATAVSTNIDPHVASFITERRKMLINGKWVAAKSGKTFPTYDPSTGDVLAKVAEGDKADIEETPSYFPPFRTESKCEPMRSVFASRALAS